MRSVEEGRICIRDGKERALEAMTGDELILGFRKGKGNEGSKSRKKIRHSR
jgi:hypothetical protein